MDKFMKILEKCIVIMTFILITELFLVLSIETWKHIFNAF